MDPIAMNHDGSILLSQTTHGNIRMCPHGCVHLTFSQVTLHFPCCEAFEEAAHVVADELQEMGHQEAFDVRHHWFSMSLTAQGSREFAILISEALMNLAWANGECEFTDEDLRAIRRSFAS